MAKKRKRRKSLRTLLRESLQKVIDDPKTPPEKKIWAIDRLNATNVEAQARRLKRRNSRQLKRGTQARSSTFEDPPKPPCWQVSGSQFVNEAGQNVSLKDHHCIGVMREDELAALLAKQHPAAPAASSSAESPRVQIPEPTRPSPSDLHDCVLGRVPFEGCPHGHWVARWREYQEDFSARMAATSKTEAPAKDD